MENKKFYVIEAEEDALDYVISVEETDKGVKYTLRRSKSGHWSEHCRNEELISMLDDGNGYKFNFVPREKKRYDYEEMEYVYLIIDFIRRQDKPIIYNVCRYE